MSSPQETQQKIKSLTENSQAMLVLAKHGEWDDLIEMEAKRHPELEIFFNSLSNEVREQLVEELRLFVEGLLDIDQQIMALSGQAKIIAVGEIQHIQAADQAMKAYNDNQSQK